MESVWQMEKLLLNLSVTSPIVLQVGVLAVIAYFLYIKFNGVNAQATNLPPSPPSWPIIGHLHLLGKLSHSSLYELSLKYGPLFFMRLGSMPSVVVSSAAMAKEFLHTNDLIFSDRPSLEPSKRVLWEDWSLPFRSYGPRWSLIRKMYMHEILTPNRIAQFKRVRSEEISSLLVEIDRQSQKEHPAVHLGKVLYDAVGNTMTHTLFGKGYFNSDSNEMDFKQMMSELSSLLIAPVFGDVIPSLKWIDSLHGNFKKMDNLHLRLDEFLHQLILGRLAKRQDTVSSAPNDFLDTLLDLNEGNGILLDLDKGSDASSITCIKACIMDMLVGGIETTAATVEWAMIELLQNPSIMRRLCEELDSKVGVERQVKESDLPALTYLQAVIKETFRLHPPLPMLIPHQSRHDCEVGGYHIPKKTRLIVNVWAIGRDPSVWKRAEEFWPERFMGSSIDVTGEHFGLLPFGSGRRGCPGINLGLLMVQLLLSNLLHTFEWSVFSGQGVMPLDMKEKVSMTIKGTPLLAIPIPRKPSPPPCD
eukprot:c21341_g1_i1 orf=139-1731(+)